MSPNLGFELLVENAGFELLFVLSVFCCVGMCRGLFCFCDKLCDVGVVFPHRMIHTVIIFIYYIYTYIIYCFGVFCQVVRCNYILEKKTSCGVGIINQSGGRNMCTGQDLFSLIFLLFSLPWDPSPFCGRYI